MENFYRVFVCIIRYGDQSATIKLTHLFMVVGGWVAVDFDSQCKILLHETRAPMGYHFMKTESAQLFPHPLSYQTNARWVWGLLYTALMQTTMGQKWPVDDRQTHVANLYLLNNLW